MDFTRPLWVGHYLAYRSYLASSQMDGRMDMKENETR